MRLITGARRQIQGPRTSGTPTACGSLPPGQGAYGPSGHQQWRFTRARELQPGPPCPATILRGSGQQDVTAAILRRYRTYPLR